METVPIFLRHDEHGLLIVNPERIGKQLATLPLPRNILTDDEIQMLVEEVRKYLRELRQQLENRE